MMTDDDKDERRSRAVEAQTRLMFENIEKDYEEHTDIESPVEDVTEDEIVAELDELEAELRSELDGNGEQ